MIAGDSEGYFFPTVTIMSPETPKGEPLTLKTQ